MADPVIRLDPTKPFSTCHGDRTPDDPHYQVHSWQGGRLGGHIVLLPFNSQGELIPDDGKTAPYPGMGTDKNGNAMTVTYQPLYTPMMRKYLAAKLKRMAEIEETPAENRLEELAGPEDDDDLAGARTAPEDDVNFVRWLKGEVKYKPFLLRAAAKKRLHKSYPADDKFVQELVTDLVLDEKLVSEDQVCAAFKRLLPRQDA